MTARTIPLIEVKKEVENRIFGFFPSGVDVRSIELPQDMVAIDERVSDIFRNDEGFYRFWSRYDNEYYAFLYKQRVDYCIYDFIHKNGESITNREIWDSLSEKDPTDFPDLWEDARITEDGRLALPILSFRSKPLMYFSFKSEYITSTLEAIYAEYENRTRIPSPEEDRKPCDQSPATKAAPSDQYPVQQEKGPKMSQPFNFTVKQITSESIIGTPLGVAVRAADGSWHIYDREKQEITDLGDLQFDSLPLWEIPSFKVASGDTIVDNDSYYHVVKAVNGDVKVVDIATGHRETLVQSKNLLGLKVYRKVIGYDSLLGGLSDEHDSELDERLLLMMSMSGQQEGTNNLLPLLLMENNGSISDNKLLLMAMLGNQRGNQDGSGLFQMLLMRELFSESKEASIEEPPATE